MGVGGISVTQLLIILLIIVLVFGTKKLKNIGSDLGGALKGFKSAMNEGEEEAEKEAKERARIAGEEEGNTFDVKAEKVEEKET